MLATNVIYGRMLILNVQVILQVIQYLTSIRLWPVFTEFCILG